MTVDNPRLDAMVSAYLAGGGRIRKIPDAIPAAPIDVLRYLKRRKVNIEPTRAKNANVESKYLHDGEIITLQALVKLANDYRRKQRLAPFDVQQQAQH